jgi:DNA-binding LacI/PurR family transcriptional regulator
MLLAVADAGRFIPGDVSVLAFGGSEWEAAYRPPISVVRHDYQGSPGP